jgi:hypothetical protein
MKFIYKIRYWLEWIALPTFAFLVFHLAGHGLKNLIGGEHNHSEILSIENFAGILILILLVWLWHRPFLKKWVPCAHTHCIGEKDTSSTPHIIAIIALCLHFFPEAGVRQIMWENFSENETVGILGVIGFASHFFVDVIVAFLISSYWNLKKYQILSLTFIVIVWLIAFHIGKSFFIFIPETAQGILFLISAFFLAMFVHVPHKPVSACGHKH